MASKAHLFHAVKPAAVRFLEGPLALVGNGVYLRAENIALAKDFGEVGVFEILPDGLCLREDKREGRESDVDVSIGGEREVSAEEVNECAGIHLLNTWEEIEKGKSKL